MTTSTLALWIVAAIAAQVLLFGLVGWLRRRSKDRIATAAPTTVSAAAPAAGAGPSPAWQGFREFLVQRRVPEDADGSICSFYLAPVDGAPLPPFRPGQFLTFQLAVPSGSDRSPLIRCYSLSDRPRSDCYRISVKRIPPPAGRPELPAGAASNYLHDRVREGDRLLVKAPSGHFFLQQDEQVPLVLIAGGIGITPLLSMLNTLLAGGSRRELWLFYGVRHGGELIMRDHLQSLARAHSNFHLHLCFSDARPDEQEGRDYQHRGRVDIPLLRATLSPRRHQFYVCGPRPMMESIVPGLEDLGIPQNDIHYEAFGPASLIRHAPPPAAAVSREPVSVTFSRSGVRFAWDPSAGSLLEFAEARGIAVSSGCRAGSCGSCQTRLESGAVEYSQQPDAEVDPGHCLLCISTPQGDLTLAA